MKKIININFQGRVIPIEETAYDILKQYIESLRRYFANEEGRDEIINDIESRIAELFSDRLKRTTTCITDEDVNAVIASIGRPEDLEEAEGPKESASTGAGASSANNAGAQQAYQQSHQSFSGRRLYRAENDKIIGGVASGLAYYFGIDPAIMRLLFVLFLFMGFGILLYIIIWIVVPSRAIVTNIRKRLYRNPENRMLGGVAGGIAAYLNIDAWIPRIIFLAPFILGVLGGIFRAGWMDFDPVPNFFFNGFGGTLFIIYIILWIVLPAASSATEKLEMRGEKVDLESIKKTVKEDLENFKDRAEKFGSEVKERAQFVGQEFKNRGQQFTVESAPLIRRSRSGIGHALGVLFKAFFLFIAGIIVFALVMALVAVLFSGVGAFPFKTFLLDGFWQNFLAWCTLILFIGIPILALLTWLIRRIIGVKSRSHYLGYTFGSLWILGLVSAILLSGMIARNFRSKTSVKEEISVVQPANDKMFVRVSASNVKYYGSDWFGFEGNMPFFSKNEDSIMINTVRVKLIKSSDSLYHLYTLKFSNGNTPAIAEDLAQRINFNVSQQDSTLYLPKGFSITRRDKFRNQQVMMVVEVPVGKRIEVDRSIESYNWFNINMNRRRGWNVDWDDRWDNSYFYSSNREYVMTQEGLHEIKKEKQRNRDDDEGEGDNEKTTPENGGNYRYKGNRNNRDTSNAPRVDSIKSISVAANKKALVAKVDLHKSAAHTESGKPLYTLLMLFQ